MRLDCHTPSDPGLTTQVHPDGSFEFRGVPEGIYTLHVLNQSGEELMSQPLNVGSMVNPPIAVKLPGAAPARPTGQTTSLARLRHRPNRRALEAARTAQKFAESGAREQALAAWEEAVAADPEFSDAHGNLGAQYARMGRASEAAAEFRRAIALDPGTAMHQSNLAVVLAGQGQLDEAESWARRAVALEGGSAIGHYVLGCVLAARPATRAEAIRQLQVAARVVPQAHQKLAQLLAAEMQQ